MFTGELCEQQAIIIDCLFQAMAGCCNRLQNLRRSVHQFFKFRPCASFLVRVDCSYSSFVRTAFMKIHRCKCLSTRRTFVSTRLCVQKLHSMHHDRNLEAVQEAEIEELKRKFEAVSSKIIFNTVLEFSKLNENFKRKKILMDKQEKLRVSKINEKDPMKDIPVALKYLRDTPEIHNTDGDEVETLPENEIVCLPYSIETKLDTAVNSRVKDNENKGVDLPYQWMLKSSELSSSSQTQLPSRMSDTSVSNWMSDYECYDESEDVLENRRPWELNYGTPDMNVPLSDVPCGGCGAVLHCQVSFCTQLICWTLHLC